MKTMNERFRDKKGSILIVAVIFATIAAISIGSYLRLAGAEMRLANTQFYSNASLNLAEAGIEEALYGLNRESWDWTAEGWSPGPTSADREKKFENVSLGSGATGEYFVRVEGYEDFAPTVISEGRVSSGGGQSTVKQIEAELTKRSYFGNGITSRSTIGIRGNSAYMASYRSSIPETALRENNLDNGSLASVLVIDESVELGGVELRGRVATGGGMPSWKPGATVGNHDTPSGTIDTDRISTDFSSSFPEIDAPDTGSYIVYDDDDEKPETLGSSGATTYYTTSRINRSGASTGQLTIQGNVTLVVDNDFIIGGNGEITIEDGGSLTLYVGGDLSIGGNGLVNESEIPSNLQIFGFGAEEQEWDIGGGPHFSAAVYAPNANFDIHGNSEVRGAIVGNDVDLRGDIEFLYDEDLRELFTDDRFAMSSWRELYGNEQHDLEEEES